MTALGLLLGIAVVISWGRLGPEPGSRNPTSWLGLLAVLAPNSASKAHLLLILVPALFLLTLCWWHLQHLAVARQVTTRAAAQLAAVWALPFTLGPVIGSRDAYAYVAQGELALRGLDPSRSVVSQLGAGPLLAAVDPRWRETRPPYGGVAVAIQKAAAGADSDPALSLAILRLIALVAVIVLVLVTTKLAAPASRPMVIVAIGANPLVLVHLIAGAHLDAVAAALMVIGLAIGRGRRLHLARFRWLAIAICTLGAMVKAPALLGAAYLSLCALMAAGPSLRTRVRGLASDVSAVAAAVGLSMAMSGSGLGWVHNFSTPGRLVTGIAPADIAANVLRGLGWLFGLHGGPHVLAATRMAAAALGVVLAVIALRPRHLGGSLPPYRWRPPTRDRLALGLLALGLLGPVLYGWYLAPALPLLALAASRQLAGESTGPGEISPGRAQAAITGLSAVLTFAAIPTLGPVWSMLDAHPGVIVGASLGAAAVIVLALLVVTRTVARLRAARSEQHSRLARPAPSL